MFDEAPKNLPVEDILEKVDKQSTPPRPDSGSSLPPPGMPRPPVIRPVAPLQPQSTATMETPAGGGKRVLMFVLLAGMVVLVLAGGGTLLVRFLKNKPAAEPTNTVANVEVPAPANTAVDVANTEPSAAIAEVATTTTTTQQVVLTPPANIPLPTPITLPTLKDTDNDGLTDAQEIAIGTDANAADTDSDGLSDTDEVRTWKTDPLNSDTDADGFTDGSEVKNGYVPTGPGKILMNP